MCACRARGGARRRKGENLFLRVSLTGPSLLFFVANLAPRTPSAVSCESVPARACSVRAPMQRPLTSRRAALPLAPAARAPTPPRPPCRRRQSAVSVAAVVQASASTDRGDGGAASMSGSPPPPTLVLYTKADCPLCAGLEVRKGKEEWPRSSSSFLCQKSGPASTSPFTFPVKNTRRPRQGRLPPLPPDRRPPDRRRHRVPAGRGGGAGSGSARGGVAARRRRR